MSSAETTLQAVTFEHDFRCLVFLSHLSKDATCRYEVRSQPVAFQLLSPQLDDAAVVVHHAGRGLVASFRVADTSSAENSLRLHFLANASVGGCQRLQWCSSRGSIQRSPCANLGASFPTDAESPVVLPLPSAFPATGSAFPVTGSELVFRAGSGAGDNNCSFRLQLQKKDLCLHHWHPLIVVTVASLVITSLFLLAAVLVHPSNHLAVR